MKKSLFSNILLCIIALCIVSLLAIVVYNQQFYKQQILAYEEELNSAAIQLQNYEDNLLSAQKQIDDLKVKVNDLTTYKTEHTISTTNAYRSWIEAQTAVEPYDLYDDLKYAYEQLTESIDKGYVGTVIYAATKNLLVPANKQTNMDEYVSILDRYFGVEHPYYARTQFITDLVKVNLLTEDGDDYYSWNRNTLTVQNAKSKLGLTEDVANAMFGLLRAIGWDI